MIYEDCALYIIHNTSYTNDMKTAATKLGPRAELIAVAVPATEIAPLDPDQLGQMAADAMRALLAEGESENTIRSYKTALRYWAAWFSLRYRQPITLPVPATVVIQFIVDHAQRKTADGLACELPSAIDRAMVDGGFKAALGPPAPRDSRSSRQRAVQGSSATVGPQSLPGPEGPRTAGQNAAGLFRPAAWLQTRGCLTKDPLEALLATCDDSFAGCGTAPCSSLRGQAGGRRRCPRSPQRRRTT